MFMMAKADDTYVKVKITNQNLRCFQVNNHEWIPKGNFINLDKFIHEKALKLLENAPTKRVLDINPNASYKDAVRAVKKYYDI